MNTTTRLAPSTVTLMRCGREHPRTYPIPADATLVAWDADPSTSWVKLNGEHVRCTIGGCTRDGRGARAMRTFAILATVTPGACDARCLEAEGASCRCSCGGANHGAEA